MLTDQFSKLAGGPDSTTLGLQVQVASQRRGKGNRVTDAFQFVNNSLGGNHISLTNMLRPAVTCMCAATSHCHHLKTWKYWRDVQVRGAHLYP